MSQIPRFTLLVSILFLLQKNGDAFAPHTPQAHPFQSSITAINAQPKRKTKKSSHSGSFMKYRQLNGQLIQCADAKELLQKLQELPGALTKPGGGGQLSKVNFSTSLHRLARHSLNGERHFILSDPRFALLLAGLAEALVSMDFRTREVSNLGWALAKLQIVPPLTSLPLQNDDSADKLTKHAKELRQAVYEQAAATNRNARQWIPQLAQLSAVILDRIPHHLEVERKQGGFKLQEYANLLWAFATSGRADAVVFGALVRDMIQQQSLELEKGNTDLRPQEWSNSMWAFATARAFDGHDELLTFTARLMRENLDFVTRYKPQEMSNTIWGVATLLSNKEGALTEEEEQAGLEILRNVATMVKDRAHEFKTQELSNSAWALATLGFGLKPSTDQSLNNYVVLASKQLEEDRQLMQEALAALVEASHKIIYKFRSQELNNLSWALARLVEEKEDESILKLLHDIGQQLRNPERSVKSQDIGTTLWAFATLDFFDDDIFRGIVKRITSASWVRAKPQEVSNTLWALATSEMTIYDVDAFDTSLLGPDSRPEVKDPVTFAFGIAAKELMKRPGQFKSQEIKDVLWSFSKIGLRHPALFRSVTEHLVGSEDGSSTTGRGLDEFSPQGLGNMAYSFARQAQLAVEATERLKGKSNISNASGRLAVYTASYFDIGEVQLQKLFAAIATSALENHDRLQNLKPQDLSNTMWTFAVLGLRHTAFVESAKSELSRRVRSYIEGDINSMTIFKGQELANLLWALATLNVSADNIFDNLSVYLKKLCGNGQSRLSMKGIASVFKRQELANIAWSCAVFGVYPSDLMKILYSGLIGSGKSTPSSMAKLYGDIGFQSQSVMSLVYVQAAVDCEGNLTSLGLALPGDFPDAWKAGKAAHTDQLTDSSIELNLSPSRIQRSVSSAFDRIDFRHVDEHIITMEDMSVDYGIKVAPKALEILSIDIANVKERVAVEVDGPAHFINVIDEPVSDAGYSKIINGKLEWQFLWDGSKQVFNGPTALKQRLLQAFGWKTISIPFWAWSARGGDPENEEQYCRELLDEA